MSIPHVTIALQPRTTNHHTDEGHRMTTTPTTDASVVTDERAVLLALHAIHVQGGFSTPDIERARAESDIARGGVIDWDRVQAEVDASLMTRGTAAALPTPAPDPAVDPSEPTTEQRVNVTAVMANIDQGAALRDRIKAMQAELKIHEDMIKDALGAATAGTDAAGNVLVRYPFRNRSGLSKEKVKDILTSEQYADCETVTEFRALYYGEG
jgi:hypothetical protein